MSAAAEGIQTAVECSPGPALENDHAVRAASSKRMRGRGVSAGRGKRISARHRDLAGVRAQQLMRAVLKN